MHPECSSAPLRVLDSTDIGSGGPRGDLDDWEAEDSEVSCGIQARTYIYGERWLEKERW